MNEPEDHPWTRGGICEWGLQKPANDWCSKRARWMFHGALLCGQHVKEARQKMVGSNR